MLVASVRQPFLGGGLSPTLDVMDRDARRMRGERPFYFTNLKAGEGLARIVDFIVERYGEFVLLQPTTRGWNWLLWAAGPLLFICAAGVGAAYIRSRSRAESSASDALSEDERRRLEELLRE